jgi:ATP-dependent DNA helicase RecG
LARDCAALANEGGGKILLGVTDKRPRRVVGSDAFSEPGRTVAGLIKRLGIQITSEEIRHAGGRVLVFYVPPRPLGVPIQYDGVFWSRAGDELRPLSPDRLRTVFQESGPDFSAELHPGAGFDDLDLVLVERFREMWMRKSGNVALASVAPRQLLEDAELLAGDRVTHAALVLFGTHPALGRHLAQAEVVFEYRSSEASIPYQQRIEFRSGFLGYLDELWNTINLRNEALQYREGFFVGNIPAFNEAVVREALLNALAHRDYRLPGSIFVRQFPRRLEIASPGGFPPGINAGNMLWRQSPRNRRIADACAKCGLVERSGQGANRMFEESIKEGKPRPDFTGTDDFQVELALRGEIQNPAFLGFLQKIGAERLATFGTRDILVLDAVQREEPLPEDLKERLPHLLDEGVIERIGRGRGSRLILSRGLYAFMGKGGIYTRQRGLDRETNKTLLLRHIEENTVTGSGLPELQQVLPALSRFQVQKLIQELRAEGRIRLWPPATRRGARWSHRTQRREAPFNAIPSFGTKPAQNGRSIRRVFMDLYARDKKPIGRAIGSIRDRKVSPLMTPRSDPPYELEVARTDFSQAVEIVAGLMGKQASGVSLQFEDGWLWIESGAGIAKTPARGTWPLTIIVGRSWVRRLAKNMPAGDPIHLRDEEGRLYANRYSEPCRRTAAKQPINPKGPELDKIMEAARILKPLRITKWDLALLVVEARGKGKPSWSEEDKKMIAMIAKAWMLLAPLGVETADLRRLVNDAVRNAWK